MPTGVTDVTLANLRGERGSGRGTSDLGVFGEVVDLEMGV